MVGTEYLAHVLFTVTAHRLLLLSSSSSREGSREAGRDTEDTEGHRSFCTLKLISAPPLTIYVVLSKLRMCLSFLICKIGTVLVTTS